MKNKLTYEVVFIISLVLIVGFTFIALGLLYQAQSDRYWAEHRRKMGIELDAILTSVYAMESSQRGYMITGDEEVHSHYKIAEKSALAHIDKASVLTVEVQEQQDRLDKLRQLVEHRRQLLSALEKLYIRDSTDYPDEIAQLVMEGDSVTGLIRQITDEMAEYEQAILSRRTRSLESYDSGSFILIAIFGFITALITMYGFISVTKENKRKMLSEKDRKKVTAALLESEVRYRSLNEASNDAIIIVDQHGAIISWNLTARYMFGYIKEEALSLSVYKIIPSFKEAFDNDNRVELTGYHKSGKAFPVEVTVSHWESDGQHFFGGTIRDITLQKKAQEELSTAMEKLKRSNEELEQFAYVASHDLQEPLRKIRSFGDRLVIKYDDDKNLPGRDYVLRMINAAERMQGLIQDLLSYSRMTKGSEEKTQVDLNEVLKNVLDDLQIAIAESGAIIKSDKLPVLASANPVQMQQLLMNLVSNAIKFRKPDIKPEIHIAFEPVDINASYTIDVEVVHPGKYYQVSVSDNGIGFDNKYVDKIFTIFQRLHGRTEYKGTGIGLAICRKICKNHGGFIRAESDGQKGSVFTILLPAEKTDV